MTFIFPHCPEALARALDGAEVDGRTVSTYFPLLMPDYTKHLPAVHLASTGEGRADGPLAAEGVRVDCYADPFSVMRLANSLAAWMETPGGRPTPLGHIDSMRVSQRPMFIEFPSDEIARATFTVLCDTRGEYAA